MSSKSQELGEVHIPQETLLNRVTNIIPGIILTSIVAWVGIAASDWIGTEILGFEKSPISGIMMAIVIALIISNLVQLPVWFKPGITFSLKRLLKLGIIFLGIRLSLGDVLQVGALGLPIIILCMSGGVLFARWLSKRLSLSLRLGTLIAIGTSICGATAIVATGPAIDAEEEELTYAIANITIFGVVAMFLYPYLANALFGDNALLSGLMLGTSIHETAQVAGSGLIYSQIFGTEQVLDVATVTKLVRNVFMVVLIPMMAYLYRRNSSEAGQADIKLLDLFPMFILGFLLFALFRTVGDSTIQNGAAWGVFADGAWDALITTVRSAAEILLAVAMAGVGLGTRVMHLRELGIRPFYVGLAAAICVAGISILALLILQATGLAA